MIKRLFITAVLLIITSASFAQTVVLDYYFNHETKKAAMGNRCDFIIYGKIPPIPAFPFGVIFLKVKAHI